MTNRKILENIPRAAQMLHSIDDDWVKVPGAEPTGSATTWHYTDANGLYGMISRDEIWVHSILDMNDTSEVAHGWNVLQAEWQKMRSEPAATNNEFASKHVDRALDGDIAPLITDTFVFSTTKRDDFLNQWQGYAGRQGFAIEFETGLWPAHHVEPTDSRASPDTLARLMPGWFNVVYAPATQSDLAQQALLHVLRFTSDVSEEAIEQSIAMIFGGVAVRMKHEGFAAEEEVRFVYHRRPDLDEQFRVAGSGIRRYVPMVASDVPFGFVTEHSFKLPIRSVMLGPVDESQRSNALATVERLLATKGYGHVRALSSRLPYRP